MQPKDGLPDHDDERETFITLLALVPAEQRAEVLAELFAISMGLDTAEPVQRN